MTFDEYSTIDIIAKFLLPPQRRYTFASVSLFVG